MNTCGYCKTIKQELEKNNIEFTEKITNKFPEEWSKVIDLINMPTTPTIYYKDSYFVPARDFSNPQQLINTLKSFKKSKFSESRQALEKIKTLNFNINIAFTKLDQLLKQIEQKINKQ